MNRTSNILLIVLALAMGTGWTMWFGTPHVGGGPDLGSEFGLFVDSTNSVIPENEGVVVADPLGAAGNLVLRLDYANWASVGLAFDEDVGANMSGMVSTDPAATKILYLRMLVESDLAGRGLCTDTGANCLSLGFFDAFPGPQDRASIHSGAGDPAMRLKWFIPDSLRDGQWHDLAIPLPPTTYAALEQARSNGTLRANQDGWHYTGAWAAGYGIGCCGSLFPTSTDSLWQEFQWDAVARIGVHFDFSDGLGGSVFVDDFYIGDAYTDLSTLGAPALVQPAATAPESGVRDLLSSVTLRWLGRKGMRHQVQVSTDPVFGAPERDLTITGDSAVVEALAASATYHWRVRALGSTTNTAWTPVRDFTIGGVSAPTLESPAPAAVGVSLTQDFEWTAVPGGISYRFQLAADTSFASPRVDDAGIPTTTLSGVVLEHSTRYFWRVRSESVQGAGEWSAPASFDTVALLPPNPELATPDDAAFDISTTVALGWLPTPRAAQYQVEVSVSELFTASVFSDSVATTSTDVSGLEKGTLYYWKVRAWNTGGWSEWTVRSFTTEMDPPAATSQSAPADGSANTSLFTALRWVPAANASVYRVQVAHSITFDVPVADTIAVAGDSLVIGPLRPFRVHFWRVKAVNRGGESEWSSVFTFRTAQNLPPVVTDDEVDGLEDTVIDIRVLENDLDPDGDALSILSLTAPGNGYVFEASPGVLRYLAFAEYSGTDEFAYTVDDGLGGRDSGQVRLTIAAVNDPPASPSVLLPLPGTSLSVQGDPGRLFRVLWNPTVDPEGDPVSYRWELSSDEAFLGVLLTVQVGSETLVEVPYGDIAAALTNLGLSELDSGLVYHRVVASDAQSDTPGAAMPLPVVRGMITNTESVDLPKELTLDGVYPNPTRGDLFIRLGLAEPASVTLRLVDALGREVRTQPQAQAPAGWQLLKVGTGRLPAGFYLVVLEIDGRRLAKPVMVAR